MGEFHKWLRLVEGPDVDATMAAKAHGAAVAVSHRIYDSPRAQHFIEISGHGEFLIWGLDALGLTRDHPELADFCLMLGAKNPRAVGLSGAVYRLEPALLNKYTRGVAIFGLREMTSAAAKSLANSTAFIDVASHEFLHLFDAVRKPQIVDRPSFTSDAKNKQKYYNDAAEFNAYYHDVVRMLTGIINSGADAKDYADIYGFTGDFKTDLEHMLGQNIYTKSFVKWLTAPRRKALLRRIYKMHAHVTDHLRSLANG